MSNRYYKQNPSFQGVKGSLLNAAVGRNGGPPTTYDYATGYFVAAKSLVDAIYYQGKTAEVDLLIYPVVFLYRHGIELGLKSLVQILPSLWGERYDPSEKNHKLLNEWKTVKDYLAKHSDFDKDNVLIPKVEDILNNLVEFDPTGQVFRYPEDKHGNQHLLEAISINIGVLANDMEFIRSAIDHWHHVRNSIRLTKPKRPDLKLSSTSIQKVIGLAKEYYSPEYIQILHTTSSKPSEILKTPEPIIEKQLLVECLDSLPEYEKAELIALIWIGRKQGSSLENWEWLVAQALELNLSTDYIVGKGALVNYLESGIAELESAESSK
jgi:hypothetical protein